MTDAPTSTASERGSSAPSDPAADLVGDGDAARPSPPLSRVVGRGTVWAVLGNLVMRFASIGVTALLARLLSPSDFGVFAVALAVFLVVSSLAELGMASAVSRAGTEPSDIAPTVVTLSLLVSGGTGLLMAATAAPLATLVGQPAAAGPLRILSLCLVLTGIFAVPGAQLVRDFAQDKIFLGIVVGFFVANPLLVLLALNGGGATAFAWSRVAGQVATGLVYLAYVSRRYRPGWRRDQVRPLLRFGLPLSLANLVSWSLLNADYLLLGRLVGAAQVGVYLIAFNVANWSTALVGSAVNSVVVPAVGRVRDDVRRLRAAVVAGFELVALVAMPVGALSAALAGPLVAALFGARWAEAAPVLAVLGPFGALFSVGLFCANVLVSLGRTMTLLLVQAAWVLVLVPGMLLGLRAAGLPGVAWAHVATITVVALPAYLAAVLRATGTQVHPVLRVLLHPLLAAALAAGAASLVAGQLDNPWACLLLGGGAGGLVYVVVVLPVVARLVPERLVPQGLRRWRPQVRTPPATEVQP